MYVHVRTTVQTYFLDNMINVKNLAPNKVQIDQKS